MNSLQVEILMQCSCSGDNGVNPLLLLAVFAGAWLLFKWIKTLIKSKGVSLMNKIAKIVIIVVLILAVGAVIALKENKRADSQSKISGNLKTLPRLVDLGADKCIPCKMMAPMLEELKSEYAGIFNVEFIDVWKNPDEAKKYGVKIIPTQIFFDATGKELFRHEGFFSKEDILSKWKELDINLEKGQKNEKSN